MTIQNLSCKFVIALSSLPLLLGSVLMEHAHAEMFRSISAGQKDTVEVTFDEGKHAIIANSPGSLGDVDIKVFDASGNYLFGSRKFGTDRIDFTVYQRGKFIVEYYMSTCMNPFGPCNVSLDFF